MPRDRSIGVKLASNKNYWQAVWWTTDHRRKVKSLGPKAGLSRSRARRRCEELARDMAINPGARDKRKSPTLEQWIESYREIRSDAADGTLSTISATAVRLVAHFGAGKRIDRISRLDAQQWRVWLGKQRDARPGIADERRSAISEQTVRKHVRIAKAMFQRAVDSDLLQVNPFSRLSGSVLVSASPPSMLTDKQVSAIIEAATGEVRTLIALCALAGLRRGEAMRLAWSDVQWDRGRLVVAHDGPQTTKRRRREVRMEPQLESILLTAHEGAAEGDTLVVAISPNNIERKVRAAISTAKVDPYPKPLHTLRKWRATTWRATYPEHVVDSWLGHSLAVARQHYASVPESSYDRSATNAPQTPDQSEKNPVPE